MKGKKPNLGFELGSQNTFLKIIIIIPQIAIYLLTVFLTTTKEKKIKKMEYKEN